MNTPLSRPNPQVYATLYHEVFKPLKEVCERVYDDRYSEGYVNNAVRDRHVNQMVFEQLTNPRDKQMETTKDLLGKFRQSLGVSEWDNAPTYIPSFIADVKAEGLTEVVRRLPKDNRITGKFTGAQQSASPHSMQPNTAIGGAGDLLSVATNPLLIDQFKLQQVRA
jgi:hypothetical protein